eukprot:PhM_4_TR14242/c2_g1_i1/m.63092
MSHGSNKQQTPAAVAVAEDEQFKLIRKLKKQLDQAQQLKERVDAGEVDPNPDQKEKIRRIPKITKELRALEAEAEGTSASKDAPKPKKASKSKKVEEAPAEVMEEYDDVCVLRSDVLAGRVAAPTKAQMVQIKTADLLKRELHMEQERVNAEMERLRIMAELALE